MITLSLLGIVFSLIFLKKETVQIRDRKIPVIEALEKIETIQEKQKEKIEPVYELVGGLSIPKINKQIKLYEEAIEPYISMGAGYEIPDRIMGKDNVVLAGHDYPELFENLVQLEMGDKMFVLENNQVFIFEVNSIFKAEEDNVHDLKQIRENQKEPMLTVYTCFGGQNTPIRTVVQGVLKEEVSIEHSDKRIQQLFTTEHY